MGASPGGRSIVVDPMVDVSMTNAEVPVEHGEHGDAGTAPAVEVRDLVKRYPKGRVNAVDGVSFAVTPGEVFGLLGPNGAGKTTTVGVLTTRVRPTGGVAWVAGVDVAADPVRARRLVAVVPQRNNLAGPCDPPEPPVPCRLPRRADRRAGPPGRRAAGRVRAG